MRLMFVSLMVFLYFETAYYFLHRNCDTMNIRKELEEMSVRKYYKMLMIVYHTKQWICRNGMAFKEKEHCFWEGI